MPIQSSKLTVVEQTMTPATSLSVSKKGIGIQEALSILSARAKSGEDISNSKSELEQLKGRGQTIDITEELEFTNPANFMKCDCEGGEYDIFQPHNVEFLKTIPKFVGEFHLKKNDELHNCKFRWFRDNILPRFNKYEIFSLDGVDIKWDLWNEHFLDYYNEVIIHIDNR